MPLLLEKQQDCLINISQRNGLKNEFRKFIEKKGSKAKRKNRFISVGMEGIRGRGVDTRTAKELFEVMLKYKDVNFMLLLKDECPKGFVVPENCVIGVTVSKKDDIFRIETLRYCKGAKGTMASFVPVEEYFDIGKAWLRHLEWLIISGVEEGEANEWEEDFINYYLHEGLYAKLAYEKSTEKNGYDMSYECKELFGYRRMEIIQE